MEAELMLINEELEKGRGKDKLKRKKRVRITPFDAPTEAARIEIENERRKKLQLEKEFADANKKFGYKPFTKAEVSTIDEEFEKARRPGAKDKLKRKKRANVRKKSFTSYLNSRKGERIV